MKWLFKVNPKNLKSTLMFHHSFTKSVVIIYVYWIIKHFLRIIEDGSDGAVVLYITLAEGGSDEQNIVAL